MIKQDLETLESYLFAHAVDDFKVLGVRQKCVRVDCDVVVEEWHHVCIKAFGVLREAAKTILNTPLSFTLNAFRPAFSE